jgi:hypothetical protein
MKREELNETELLAKIFGELKVIKVFLIIWFALEILGAMMSGFGV